MAQHTRSSNDSLMKWVAPVIAVGLMAACAAPIVPPRPRPAVVVARATEPAPAPAPAPAPPPAATAAPAPPALPYSAAVAARFPEPSVTYRTPAFESGRSTFTSNEELAAALRGLLSDLPPTTIKLLPLGASQRGVPLEALLFTRSPAAAGAEVTPESVLQDGRPTVLLVAQQHGDEPAGSEALLVVAQSLARGALQPVLDRINVVILPRANPDGAAAGQRVTASGIDANRDHLLLKTPEAQAQAKLTREFQPAVVIDAHEYTVVGRYLEKFGTVQRFDALLQYAMTANLPPFITRAAEEWFRQPVLASLKAQGLSAEWYYTTSTDLADKKVSMGGVQPDTGRNVNGLKNAVSLLIETRGVGIGRLHLNRRVHTHVTAITSVLTSAAVRAADLVKLRQFVANEVSSQACQGEVIVDAAATASEYELSMLDPVTGADKTVSVAWDSALALRTLTTRPRPCGYWLAADQTDAVLRLRGLGVQVQRIETVGVMRGETYRETARDVSVRQDVRGSIADGGGVLRVQVQTSAALIDVPVGSYYVSLAQPLANLVLAAMEPDTQNSYLANHIVTGVGAMARVLAPPEIRLSVLP